VFRLSHREPDRRYRERSEARGHFQFAMIKTELSPRTAGILAEIPLLIVSLAGATPDNADNGIDRLTTTPSVLVGLKPNDGCCRNTTFGWIL
jgi:hypothetical protein